MNTLYYFFPFYRKIYFLLTLTNLRFEVKRFKLKDLKLKI